VTARRAVVLTHRRPEEVAPALRAVRAAAEEAGVTLRFPPEETAKHGLVAAPGLEVDAPLDGDVDLCLVLGGDGSILRALRAFAGTDVPVFAVNFGELGFLATIEPGQLDDGLRRAFALDFEVLRLPGLALSSPCGDLLAINDVSVQRGPGGRVASLAYAVGPEEIGRVRCDGLVVATPAGSTGYNLANGGPVLAWGVEGFVVSFIAPHSLTARALVVAPGDAMTIHNLSRDEAVEVEVDGRPCGGIGPGEAVSARFVHDQGCLAQIPGATFYHRLREKFGRLSR
jgi:NAD+ kinase